MVIYFNKKSEEYISNVEEVSKFTISNNFDFLMVNCFDEKFRKLCIDNKVSRFPFTQIFLKGEESPFVPFHPDIESLLEFIDKINSPTIKELKKSKELTDFNKNYGDVSFLLIDEGGLNDFEINENIKIMKEMILECYEKVAEKYKPIFHFAYMSQRKYPNFYNINLPAIIV